jgi:carbonic anhydrase
MRYVIYQTTFLSLFTISSVFAQEALNNQPIKEAVWSYDNDYTGQEEWGLITPAFAACGIGTSQSPIHISRTENVSADVPMFHYKDDTVKISNIGYTFEIIPNSEHAYEENGTRYILKSIQFHTPSEHIVKDTFYPMEMQFIHESADGKKLIVAIFSKIGEAIPELDAVLSAIPDKQDVSKTATFNLALLLPHSFAHYAYTGSLTTPPCTEGIEWRVLKKNITISNEQMMVLAKFTRRNSRLAQPVYMRTVKEVN